MNTLASLFTKTLSILAIIAFHVLTALFVLLYVAITAVVVLVRWCVSVARRATLRGARRSSPATAR